MTHRSKVPLCIYFAASRHHKLDFTQRFTCKSRYKGAMETEPTSLSYEND